MGALRWDTERRKERGATRSLMAREHVARTSNMRFFLTNKYRGRDVGGFRLALQEKKNPRVLILLYFE